METERLYDTLKMLGYTNHMIDANLQAARENHSAIIKAGLEADHERVYKVFYGMLWENELRAAYELILTGDIDGYIDNIF